MFIAYSIGIANGHKDGRLDLFDIVRPIVRFQIYTNHFLYKFRETRRIIPKTIILLLYRTAFEYVGSDACETGFHIRPPTIVLIGARQHHQPAYLLWMTYR